MKYVLFVVSLFALILAGCRLSRNEGPAKPAQLSKDSAEKIQKEIEKERAENNEWLRSSPTSYLAATARLEFGNKQMLTVGSAADNDMQISAADIEPHHLRITVSGDKFHIACIDPEARFKIKEEINREATVAPSSIQIGHYTLRLSHQYHPALILFDPMSPHLKEYKGLSYYPVDLSYRYEVSLIRYSKHEQIEIGSTRGYQRNAEKVGWVQFLVENTSCRLETTRLLEPGTTEDDVQILFQDATSGKETYPLGRYVDLKKLDNGKFLLDFNLAYNPACAFSNYYNCPIPPKSNTLSIAIRAGEMDAHFHHAQHFASPHPDSIVLMRSFLNRFSAFRKMDAHIAEGGADMGFARDIGSRNNAVLP
jgi:uncharacterized protein